jgi:choline dehydrogenase-like flavoprotein
MAGSTFDYVIVGAGSAGCVLANRLSEDPSVRVALLEAGGKDRNPWIHVPAGYYRNFTNPDITWQFGSGPEPHLNNRIVNWPRGRVLGGSSAINGLLYVRGQAQDFNVWRQPATSAGRTRTCCPTSSARRTRSAARTPITAPAARSAPPTCGWRRTPCAMHSSTRASRPASRATRTSTVRARKAPAISSSPTATAGAARRR